MSGDFGTTGAALMMTYLNLLIISAYLLGSLSGSLLLGKLRGVDIRSMGSGNAGGTNAFRTQGLLFAIGVVLIDIGKGMAAAVLAQKLLPGNPWAASAAVFAAVIGHIWPLFHGFRGGKGAATLVGGLIIVWPQALPLMFGVWIVCLLLTGYVGLSTVLAAFSLLLSGYWFEAGAALELFALASAGLLTFSHRGNLRRMYQGTESCFEKARILGRLISGSRG